MKILMSSVMQLAAVAIAVCLCSVASDAAEISAVSRPGCKLLLTGEIIDGDVRKVAHAAKSAGMPSVDDPSAAFCLNSSGGSFEAGLELSRYFASTGIRTFVDNGESCLSACAVAFLGGRVKGDEADGIARVLHVGGTLGFHAPFLNVPGGNYDKSTVEAAYLTATRALAALMGFSSDKGSFSGDYRVKPGLVLELLQRGPSEFLYIDTIDKAGRWNIQLAGLSGLRAVDRLNYVHACSNFLAWEN